MEHVESLPELPLRFDVSHKGTYGNLLIIGGSRGMSGAPALAGLAALRSGVGLVTVAVPAGIQSTVSRYNPSYMTWGLPENEAGTLQLSDCEFIRDRLKQTTALAVGPGLGQSAPLPSFVKSLYLSIPLPVILDADALNALADLSDFPQFSSTEEETSSRLLTPHPGEFSRLIDVSISEIQQDREQYAANFAKNNRVVLVLKGNRSIITDGTKIAINQTGNHGMAKGGSGDVLTGLLGGLLAQGMNAFEAAQLGVHLHGLAGDLAVERISAYGMTPTDQIQFLPMAWNELIRSQ